MNNKTALMVLASIMSFRMLGLFMILPVFSVYAEHTPGATTTLIGLALGIYGLTQACLQIPFGMLSDRIGRKPVILMGLCLFFIGSVFAALSHSICYLIIGRALQGAGAIGSTVLALVADITPVESRSKAMAFMGLTIGLAFTFSMIVGPIINHWLHLSGIFWVTALLALFGIALTSWKIPLVSLPKNRPPLSKGLNAVLHNPQLLRLNFGIFSLHAILTSLFIVIPLILTKQLLLSEWQQISLYLIILILAFAFALPFIIIAEKKKKIKQVFIAGIITIFIAQCAFLMVSSKLAMSLTLMLFFTAFTLLEALLPSLISKTAPPERKGAAMGVYSSSQFLGIFIGGSVGGLVFARGDMLGVFIMCAVLALLWFALACSMKKPV
ncbi:MAG: MFS transporter [Gammaproteobacteria bacterium]|nr:MFS transporter [Gammaproteobacteria bacterium]